MIKPLIGIKLNILIFRQFVLFYSIEMYQWNLNDFALDLLEKTLSLTNPPQEKDSLVYEDWILMRSLKYKIYLSKQKNYMVSIFQRFH
jgi:hypothetical protein